MELFGYHLGKIKLGKPASQPTQPGKKQRASYRIKKEPLLKKRFELQDIFTAEMMANNPDRPDRSRLYAIYRYTQSDSHLENQLDVARMLVQGEPYSLYKGKTANEELTKFILKPWFNDILTHIIDAEWWGHSLVECVPDLQNQTCEVVLIPREHVSPERQQILIEPRIDADYIAYADIAEKLNLLEFGNKNSFGKLYQASFNVLSKFYSRSDWSRASEKFGMPILHLKVDTNDDAELNAAEEKAANFGTDGYVVTQKNDEATVIERKGDKLHENYLENIKYCDDQNSQLINGQTGTSDQKAFVGAAEVHERILSNYTRKRMRNVKFAVNFVILPFLINKGFTFLQGLEFDFEAFKQNPSLENDPNNPNNNPNNDPSKQGQKKN